MNDSPIIGLSTNFFTGQTPVLEVIGFTLALSPAVRLEIARVRTALASLPNAYEIHVNGDKLGLEIWRLDPDNLYQDEKLQQKAEHAANLLGLTANLERVEQGFVKLCISQDAIWATYIEHGQLVESVSYADVR